MELHARPNADDGWVVSLHGELDLAAVPAFRAATVDALRDGWTDLVIDLKQVEFIDSAGLGVLIGLRRRTMDVDGSLTLLVSAEVLNVLSVSGIDSLFDVELSRSRS